MKDFISVIVPVYNLSGYNRKCLDSKINQTYKKIELIIVNDGSTDGSTSICDEYASKDFRIVVIHKENGGLSSARNAGLDIAKGSLICFVDGDDYIEPNMIEELKNNLNKYNSDMSIYDYYYHYKDKTNRCLNNDNFSPEAISDIEKFYILFNDYKNLSTAAWNKLYKRELFDNFRYPIGKIHEDAYIICELLDRAKSISFVKKPLYNYVYRADSLSHTISLKKFEDKIGLNDAKIAFFNKKGLYDLSIKEKDKKSYNLILGLAKLKQVKLVDDIAFERYYKELVATAGDIKWTEANKYVKRFKVFDRAYVYWRAVEYKVYEWGKRIYAHLM